MATINVTGRDSSVSSTNRQHAEEKLSKLARYFNAIEKIEATLGFTGDEASVEVVISIPRGSPIVCHCRAKDLYSAIDLVVDKAEIQLTKHKERVRTRKAKTDMAGTQIEPAAAPHPEDEQLESYDDVIDKRDFG